MAAANCDSPACFVAASPFSVTAAMSIADGFTGYLVGQSDELGVRAESLAEMYKSSRRLPGIGREIADLRVRDFGQTFAERLQI